MKTIILRAGVILSIAILAACNSTNDNQKVFATVKATGGGSVVQILPGPAVFAEKAVPTIKEFPSPLQKRFNKVSKMGPFSNNTTEISGDFSITMKDAGEMGDKVDGIAKFQTADGTNWRFEFDDVNPDGSPPHAPHFGGIVTDFVFHGPTALHTPLSYGAGAKRSLYVGICQGF